MLIPGNAKRGEAIRRDPTPKSVTRNARSGGAPQDDDDSTIRIRPRQPRRRFHLLMAAIALTALLATVGVTWILSQRAAPIALAPPATAVLDAPLADEAEILRARAPDMLVFRFRDAPAILVLSFPSLLQQGYMLDRLAAFVEKAGLPHDRALRDSELEAAMRQAGETRETYYYGHDYSAADLARFFAVAARDRIPLDGQEVRLRTLLEQAGMLTQNAVGALISIPPEDEAQQIDASSRKTVLHHELSHGLFFTDPAYAGYARHFWQAILDDKQRAGFRRFLGSEGYDTTNEELMLNETQAFLVHTPDRRYFLPDRVGLTEAEAARLRDIFVRGMPAGWLKAAAILQTHAAGATGHAQ